ncbi:MAG: hypothetical protein IIZ61_09175, partial [Lachnospiraceae bacterium]|nr:hypothetical protein [Lachnospiraceae bacterium]
RSELYKKDKNRNDLLKNIYPESKSFREDGLSDDEELYNEVKSYLSLATKDIDLSSDEKVVENSRQLEKILGMHRRFLYNVQKYPNFIKSLPKALGEKIMAHATKINLLTNYYRICRMIITDPLYSTRENKELGFSIKKDDSPERQRLSNLLMLKMQLEGKMRKITGEDVANAKSADGIHIESKTQRGFDGVLLDIKSAIGNKEFNKLTPHPGTENTKFGKVLMEAYRSARGNGNEGNELYKILCKNKDIRVDGEKITETLFREPYILANFRAMQGDDMTEDRFNEMIKNLGSKEEEEQLLGMKEVYRLVLDQARYIKKKYKGSFVFMNHAESKQHALEIQRDLQGVTNIYEFLRFFIKTPSLYKDEEGFNEVMELSEYFAGIMQHNGALAFASNFEQVTNNEPGFGNYMLYKAQLLAGSLDSNDRIDGLVSSNSILSLLEKQQDMQAEWDVVKEVVDTNKLFPKLNEGINSFMETCNMRKYKDSEGFYVDRELGALTSSMATLQVLFPLLDKAVKDKNAAVAKTYYGAAKPIFYNSIKGKCEEYLKNIKKSTESSKLIKKFSDTYLSDLTKYFDSIDAQVEELVKNAPKVERKTRNRQSVKVEEQDNGFNDKELRLPFPIEARLVEDDQIPKEEKEAETGYKKLRDDAETQMEKDLQSGAVKEEKFDGISYRRGRIENLKNELKLHREKDRSKLDAKKIAELDKNIARCEQRIKDHERMIPLLEKRKADNKIPQITVHDNKFDKSGLDVYGKVIENGELYPFENLMDGIKQGPSTCYYTSLLIGLIKQGNTDFIKNELVREYSPTQAIVKLHDEDGMPVEIIVDKSRTKTDHRPLWIVCLDKAVAVLLNKGGFDAEKRDELANAGSQAGYAADVDWEEFSRDENYCKDGSVFLKDVSKGSEDLAFKMIFGSVPIKFSTRGSEYVDGVVAKTEHVDEGDIAIGKIKALLKQGKVVNASTCSHLMPDFVPANLKKYEDNYFGAYDAVKFRASSHLQAEHTYLVYAVDEDRHVVKMVNPIMGNEIEVTFKNFRRHFTDVRAGA